MLAIDWDQNQLHVLSAQVSRAGVNLEKVHSWQLEQPVSPAAGEAAGLRLRNLLKEAGIAAAPVVICLGRDRVILKEIYFPSVAADDEPGLVHFQASKDLTETPEQVVVDYSIIGKSPRNGENHAFAVIVRRSIVTTFQALCKAAGLRLTAMVPRPFGIAKALQFIANPKPMAADTSAVLTIGSRWADFCVVKDGNLLFARSLTVGPTLAGEIRRNFALYRNHAEIDEDRDLPTTLYFGGNGHHGELIEQLQSELGMRVQQLKPVPDAVQVSSSDSTPAVARPVEATNIVAANAPVQTATTRDGRGALTGAVGLLHTYARKEKSAINFVQPKEPKPPKSTNWVLVGGAIAAGFLLVVGFIYIGVSMVSEQKRRLKSVQMQHNLLKGRLDGEKQAGLDIKALKNWEQRDIPWLQEVYDLTARFPMIKGLYLTNMTATPLALKKTKKDKKEYTARVILAGIVPTGQKREITTLVQRINSDPYCQASVVHFNNDTDSTKKFLVQIDLAKRPPDEYRTILPAALTKTKRR